MVTTVKGGKRVVKVPVDGRSGAPLFELLDLLRLTRKAEPLAKEAVFRSRVKLRDNGDVNQALLAVQDDVVDLVVEMATGGFQIHPRKRGLWNCELPWMVLVGMVNSDSFSPCSFQFKPWDPM